jgi:hypothetical protein
MCYGRIRGTPDGDGGFYERAFARLEGHGPSREKEEAEVSLLKAQAKLCEEELIAKKATSKGLEISNKGAEIANRAAQIANLRSIMETGELGVEEMADCRKKLYQLGTEMC